MLCQLSNL